MTAAPAPTLHPDFTPAIFYPIFPFVTGRDKVLIGNVERSDFTLRKKHGTQEIVFERLSYDEACQVQVVFKKPPYTPRAPRRAARAACKK